MTHSPRKAKRQKCKTRPGKAVRVGNLVFWASRRVTLTLLTNQRIEHIPRSNIDVSGSGR